MRFGGFGSVIYSNLTSNRSKCSLLWQKYKSQEAIWNPDEPALNDLAPEKESESCSFYSKETGFVAVGNIKPVTSRAPSDSSKLL